MGMVKLQGLVQFIRTDVVHHFSSRQRRSRGKFPNACLGKNKKGKRRSQKEAKAEKRALDRALKRAQKEELRIASLAKKERNQKEAKEKAELLVSVKLQQEEDRRAAEKKAKLDAAIKKHNEKEAHAKRIKRLKIAAEAKRASAKLAGKPSARQKAKRGQPHKIYKANKAGTVLLMPSHIQT